jgi:hypothetical protein
VGGEVVTFNQTNNNAGDVINVKPPAIIDILTALVDSQGAIVSAAFCSEDEIAFAKEKGRFYTDESGFGYVLRYQIWRESAESAEADAIKRHEAFSGLLLAAVMKEREACAALADNASVGIRPDLHGRGWIDGTRVVAEAIRLRGKS